MKFLLLNYKRKDESPHGSIGHTSLFFNNDPCKGRKYVGTKYMELFETEFSYDHSNLFYNTTVNLTLNSQIKFWKGQKRNVKGSLRATLLSLVCNLCNCGYGILLFYRKFIYISKMMNFGNLSSRKIGANDEIKKRQRVFGGSPFMGIKNYEKEGMVCSILGY